MTSFKNWLFLLLMPFSASAQSSEIAGVCPELSGMIVEVSRSQNPISGEKIQLDSDTVDAEGRFQLSFVNSDINQVWLSVNRFTAPLFIAPQETYTIEIIPSQEFILIDSWRPGSFEYVFTNLDSADVNAAIAEFNQSYFEFFTQHAMLIGNPALRKEVKAFESKHSLNEKDFLAEYIRYTVAEMKLMAGFPKNEIYSSYLKDEQINFSNPSFTSFFNVFYSDYFNRFDVNFGGAGISNQISVGLSYDELDSLFLTDDFLQREDIRQWVILKSVKENIYLKSSSGEKLVEILRSMEPNAHNQSIERAAEKIRTKYQRSVSPFLPELFPTLKELELEPKPSLVIVAQSKSNEWKRESSLLAPLLEKYGEYFQVMELTLGVEEQKERDWYTMGLNSPESLLDDLSIYRLPWYGWMEPDGSLTKDIKKPSEGLEERLYSIRAKALQEQKIKVGQ